MNKNSPFNTQGGPLIEVKSPRGKYLMNKRGIEMTISTVIVMLISLFVLVFLIMFFVKTGDKFEDTTDLFIGGGNIDEIIGICNNHILLDQVNSYCCVEKNFNFGDSELKMSCFDASNESWGQRIDVGECENVC